MVFAERRSSLSVYPFTKEENPRMDDSSTVRLTRLSLTVPDSFSLCLLLLPLLLVKWVMDSSTAQHRLHLLLYLHPNDFQLDRCILNPNYVRSIHQIRWTSFAMPVGPTPIQPQTQTTSLTSCLCRSRFGSPTTPQPVFKLNPASSGNSESVNSQVASPQSSFGPICRICHEGDAKEELVAPCRCAGSMALVHRGCIEKWLSSSNLESCEICKFVFDTSKQPRPYIQWLQEPSNPSDLRNLGADLLCFILLSPLAAMSAYLCVVGARHYAAYAMRWEASGLSFLALFLVAIYCVWCSVTFRYHSNVIREWRKTHQKVKLVEMRRAPSSLYMMRHLASDSDNNNNNTTDSPSLSSSSYSSQSHVVEITGVPSSNRAARTPNPSILPLPTRVTATMHSIIRASSLPETAV